MCLSFESAVRAVAVVAVVGGGGVETERTRILACVVCVSERRFESVRMRGACGVAREK